MQLSVHDVHELSMLEFFIDKITLGDVYEKFSVLDFNVLTYLNLYLMWFIECEKFITWVVNSHETLNDILVKAFERDATRVDLEDFFYRGSGMLVISCENKCYVVFRCYCI